MPNQPKALAAGGVTKERIITKKLTIKKRIELKDVRSF